MSLSSILKEEYSVEVETLGTLKETVITNEDLGLDFENFKYEKAQETKEMIIMGHIMSLINTQNETMNLSNDKVVLTGLFGEFLIGKDMNTQEEVMLTVEDLKFPIEISEAISQINEMVKRENKLTKQVFTSVESQTVVPFLKVV